MREQFILSPYYMTSEASGLRALARPEWTTVRINLPPGRQTEQLAALNIELRDRVRAAVDAGQRPALIAGDCVTALGLLAGLRAGGVSPTLIWLDAHGDFNTWETTPSGFVGGMPLAMLVGRGEQTILQALAMEPLPEERVILCDARDLDSGEREALAESGVQHLPDAAALLNMPLPAGPLYVHFDTDFLSPEDAPAMNYPAPGGPPLPLVRAVFARLAASGQVVALSLSAWNPELDGAGRTAGVCLELLDVLLGPG